MDIGRTIIMKKVLVVIRINLIELIDIIMKFLKKNMKHF